LSHRDGTGRAKCGPKKNVACPLNKGSGDALKIFTGGRTPPNPSKPKQKVPTHNLALSKHDGKGKKGPLGPIYGNDIRPPTPTPRKNSPEKPSGLRIISRKPKKNWKLST